VPAPPSPVWIFHITAIPNLAGIAAQRALRSKRWLGRQQLGYSDIAYQGAQGRRASKSVPLLPGGVIHDYVPFYFAPRSPMLGAINRGCVPDCTHRQDEIIHFVIDLDTIVKAGLPFVFYNYNATLSIAECFCELADLDKIDWPVFFEHPRIEGYCKYWHSRIDNPRYALRMETRQAELLVHETVPLALVKGIGTINDAKADEVRAVLDGAGVEVSVKAKPGWYF
jgi:hypothetical protein